MWVFDGEQWIEEDKVPESTARKEERLPYDIMLPELQVVEITPVTPSERRYVPILPLP